MTSTGTSLDQLRQDLAAGRVRLLQVISGVTEQQFKRRPPSTPEDSDPWCIAEILTHLLIDEKLWTQRIDRALAASGAPVAPSDREQSLASIKSGRHAPVPQIIHGLLAARRDLELRLAKAEAMPGALTRSVLHPERGSLSVEWMVHKVISHEQEHAESIERLRPVIEAMAQPGVRTSGGVSHA